MRDLAVRVDDRLQQILARLVFGDAVHDGADFAALSVELVATLAVHRRIVQEQVAATIRIATRQRFRIANRQVQTGLRPHLFVVRCHLLA